MRATTLRWCNWSGWAFLLLWLIGFVFFAHVVPPPSPNEDAGRIAEFYRTHTGGIRFGLMLPLFASPLYASWSAALAAQLKRVRAAPPVMADLQLVLGGLTVLVFMIPALLLEIAAFRPERSPELIQALNDIPWMMFIGMGATAILQPFVVGVVILQDRAVLQGADAVPVFPRWVGFFNIWTAILFLPGPFCVFFKTGPLAWDGLFTWWIPFVLFAAWMVVMIVMTAKAIRTDDCDSPPLDPELEARINAIVDARINTLRGTP
jgi:hypothetical protein